MQNEQSIKLMIIVLSYVELFLSLLGLSPHNSLYVSMFTHIFYPPKQL